jgi:hypothetical protein
LKIPFLRIIELTPEERSVLAACNVTPSGLSIMRFEGAVAPDRNSNAVVVCAVEPLYSSVLPAA